MTLSSDAVVVPLLSREDCDDSRYDVDLDLGVDHKGEEDASQAIEDRFQPPYLRSGNGGMTSYTSLVGQHFKPIRNVHKRLVVIVFIVFIVMTTIILVVRRDRDVATVLSRLHEWELSGEAGSGVEQAQGLNWSGEAELWRNYKWQLQEPHESLTQMVTALTKEEVSIREWLLSTRPLSQIGAPVGLSQSSPVPARIREGPAMVRTGAGPGRYRKGSREKWESLRDEWQTGRPHSRCSNTSWMADYAKLHHEIVTGTRPPKVLEFSCREGHSCGGNSDRLLGIFTSLLYAILTSRALLITWDVLPFEVFFDAVRIDWAQPYMPMSKRSIHPGLPVLKRPLLDIINIEVHKMVAPPMSNMEYYLSVELFDEKRDDPPWLRVSTNRGGVINSFNYSAVKPALLERGFDRTTAYSCMTDFLFRPKREPMRFITEYDSVFSLPTVFSIALQIRTGDRSMMSSVADAINTVARYQQFFDCADKLAERYARDDQKVVYYLVTDSSTLEAAALRQFPDRLVVTGLTQGHPEFEHGHTGSALAKVADDTTNALVESMLIGKTDYQIITETSGFGKLPVFIRGVEGTTISLPREGGGTVDCANTDAWVLRNVSKLDP
ncbi:BZ3500_MvSof-1268-A1-R1_Chr6-3g08819 [Microbotryum saponariae]|uniref:BZ3500_MvSof-1268-A1-R1_Chr6-3g08819 protein n=1 Tax=Microbotryum saponariae TaxID=289078 RepID=A0A2X0LCQ5_9BASI|nr:BZ3500_MvSof-1268-A1-R1_Chr6-3g08819 [Microbotryum saponariae]SDA07420.1 BZ3501_MvSof-1269-A2-R1_Chr6-2g08522 [Microbotryum saponariae]